MEITLWIVQAILAVLFVFAGIMKLFRSQKMLESLGEMKDMVSERNLKLIGLAELLGAIGLILPELLDVLPILTPVAAVGLAALMLGAVLIHAAKKERSKVAMPFVLFAGSVFVAVSRFII